MYPLNPAQLSEWLRRLSAIVASREVLEALVPQLAAIAAMFLLAWAIHAATRPWTNRLVDRATIQLRMHRIAGELQRLLTFCYAWLLLVTAEGVGARLGGDVRLVGVAASLTALWIVLRLSARLMRDAFLARVVAIVAWIVAALDILGLLAPTAAALNNLAITVGTLRLSLLLVIKAGLMMAILLRAALTLARLISARIQRVTAFSPSIQVLTGNLIKIALVCAALLIGLNTVGIDLTAFTVFSGAVGVGLGFGLQKIVSNFVSGIILLLERSVKPGDVIEVGSTFGSITYLGARYASVSGQGISDPEREPDHQRSGQLVVLELAGQARRGIRRRLCERFARGARLGSTGCRCDRARARISPPGLPSDGFRRQRRQPHSPVLDRRPGKWSNQCQRGCSARPVGCVS
ncbi:MAG TPA: mechanosensitive ion channel domain-containing protein [Stellaceae bacterium]